MMLYEVQDDILQSDMEVACYDKDEILMWHERGISFIITILLPI